MNAPLILTRRLLCSLLIAANLASGADDWEKLPSIPVPCGGFAAGVHGGRIWLLGGTNWEGGVKNWLRTSFAFHPDRLEWTQLPDLKEPAAYGLAIHSADGLTIIGGSDGKRPLLSIDGQPDHVVLSSGGKLGSQIILVGGTNDAANLAGITKSAFAIAERQVTKLPDYPGQPVAVAAHCVHGDELLMFGGLNYDSKSALPVNTNSAFAYSASKTAWRSLAPLPEARRGLSAVNFGDGRVYLAGGYGADFSASAWIYDIKSNSYSPAKPLPYAGMVGLVIHGSFLYCLGGEDKMKSRTDRCFRIPTAALSKP
ncbi:MAG: hypothetical protein JNJ83_11335 [Verrucomicrobiaceae bacterium]|nr:hypothetical protein [Verrucomicrobiaceae bacterium]